jgi:hypothetical protein
LSSAKVWSGVFGSSQPSRPIGAKFRGSVIDMSGLRSAKEQKSRSTISKQQKVQFLSFVFIWARVQVESCLAGVICWLVVHSLLVVVDTRAVLQWPLQAW